MRDTLREARQEANRRKAIKQARQLKKAWIKQRIDAKLEQLALEKAIRGDL